MDILDFTELMAEILDLEEDDTEDIVAQKCYARYGIELEDGFELAKALLQHTVTVEAALSKKVWHAFVSNKRPVMLMKLEAVEEADKTA